MCRHARRWSGSGNDRAFGQPGHQRRTAAFLCDVERGIRDVVGEVEPESDRAGGLIEAFDKQPEGYCARDFPELALGLLAGSLKLTEVGCESSGERVASWYDRA